MLAGLAVLPVLPAAAMPREVDPIFAAIEKHRELSADYDAAVSISAKLPPGPEFEAADEVTADRHTQLLTTRTR